MPADDLSPVYLNSRGAAYPRPSDMLDEQIEADSKRKAGMLPEPDPMQKPFAPMIEPMIEPVKPIKGVMETAGSVAKDVGMGVIEAPVQVVAGASDAVQELLNFADEAGQSIESWLGIKDWPTILQFTNEKGELDFDLLSRNEWEGKTDAEVGQVMPDIADSRSTTGGIIRDVSQFITAYALPAKKLKGVMGAGKKAALGEAATAGAIADAVGFDPHEDRLSNLIESQPSLNNPVTEFLAASPEDSAAEGRFKNAAEGLGLGVLTEGLLSTLKAIRSARVAKLDLKDAELEKQQIDRLAEAGEVEAKPVIDADGFDTTTTYYRGSLVEGEIEPSPATGGLIFVTKDPARASQYATSEITGYAHGAIQEDSISFNLIKEAHPEHFDGAGFLKSDTPDEVLRNILFDTDTSRVAHISENFESGAITKQEAIDRYNEGRSSLAEGGHVTPYHVKIKNPAGSEESPIPWKEAEEIGAKGYQEQGYDAVWVTEGDGAALAVFDKANLRSKFEAKTEAPPPKEEPVFQVGSKKAGEERALNINLDRLETTDDIKAAIDSIGEKFADDINLERREVITHEETEKLADSLGMTVEDLLNRRRGDAFNAEQAVAARKILVASGKQLTEAAAAAKRGGEDALLHFRRVLSQHTAIQKQVSGLTAEAGRALSSFNIRASSDEGRERMIREAIEAGGGEKQTKQMADMFATLEDPRQINIMAEQVSKATKWDMVYEAWINGLLSSPATHSVNILGNAITIGWQASERKVASWIGGALDRQTIQDGEFKAQLWGIVKGAQDGMRLAWQALKTGEPTDEMTKLETAKYRAISADNLELSGTAGRFADFIGETVRLPGRFLTAGDEFFKSIGYRMELNAQAFRTAQSEGLVGEEMAARIVSIINDPPENIHLAAMDAARYQTFTNELGEAGKKTQELVGTTDDWTRKNFNVPSARVIMPFIKTPVNIMSYVGERTPLAFVSKSIRDDISAGGARRDLALARISTGSMIMAAAADLALSGQITGGGPADPVLKQNLMNTGWQPYSIKIDGTYYAYSRLDPVGATIGMAADAAEVLGQVDSESDATDVAAAIVVSVAQNVTSKTYLSGLSDFFEIMSQASTDPEANNYKAVQWIERMAGSAVPAGVAQVERTLSPELSATQGIIEKVRSRIPGLSDDLPPRRNIFGEPIVLQGGIGPDIMSPIYTSTDKSDMVTDEIVANRTRLTMPQRTMNGIKLTPEEYDQYIQIFSGAKPGVPPFKTHLEQVMQSSEYQNGSKGPDGMRSLIILRVKEAHNSAAKALLLEQNPDLATRVSAKKDERRSKLLN